MNRFFTLIILFAAFFLSVYLADGHLGASLQCVNGHCRLAAFSSLGSTLVGLALVLFLVFYPRKQKGEYTEEGVGAWRRFWAVMLDFGVVFYIMTPIAALPLLFMEAHYTGGFHWSFMHNHASASEMYVMTATTFVSMVACFCYFYLHPKLGRTTPGQYVLGYAIRTDRAFADEMPSYLARTLLAFIGLCAWPVSVVIFLFNRKRKFWWDSATHTEAVRVRA